MDVRLSEVLGALSHALDITEGQPRGHAERTCLIAMRIARQLGLDAAHASSLFHAALLKDAGCSSQRREGRRAATAPTTPTSSATARSPTTSAGESLRHLVRSTAPGALAAGQGPPPQAARRPRLDGSRELTELRCERGAEVARARRPRRVDRDGDPRARRALGRPRLPARAGGRATSRSAAGSSAWPRPPRSSGRTAARRRRLRGGARAPRHVVRPGAGRRALRAASDDRALLGDARPAARRARWSRRTACCSPTTTAWTASRRAFAGIVDAKSPYTGRHSDGVAEIAARARRRARASMPASSAACTAPACCTTSASSASPTASSTSPASSTTPSGRAMRRHPSCTLEILAAHPGLRRPGRDRRRPSREPRRQRLLPRADRARRSTLPARILAVADVAEALSADAPLPRGAAADEGAGHHARRRAGTRWTRTSSPRCAVLGPRGRRDRPRASAA